MRSTATTDTPHHRRELRCRETPEGICPGVVCPSSGCHSVTTEVAPSREAENSLLCGQCHLQSVFADIPKQVSLTEFNFCVVFTSVF